MSNLNYFGNVEPDDLFNPRHYERVRQPRENAETLPGWTYTSQAFFERERDTIFFKQWNCVGHVGRVPNVGSYITFDFIGVPLIVLRDDDGELRAFINQCTHRGALLATDEGQCKQLKCPYHAWAFSLKGDLLGTPLFEEHATFKKADHGLRQIRLETWAGLMWINFDAASPSLLSHLGDLPERTAPWKLEDMVCVSRNERLIKANWKHVFENYSDSYHVPFVHKTSLNFRSPRKRELHDTAIYKGNYIMHAAWFDGTRGVLPNESTLPQMELPEELHGSFYPWVYPNTGMGFHSDIAWVAEVYPHGPDSYTRTRSFFVPKETAALPDFAEIFENYVRNSEIVNQEDVDILERQQVSVRSPAYKPGRFANMDRLVHDCQRWVLDHVLDERTALRKVA